LSGKKRNVVKDNSLTTQRKILKLLNASIKESYNENLTVKKLMLKGVNEGNIEVV